MESLFDLFDVHFSNPWIGGMIRAGLIISIFVVLLILSDRLLRPAIRKLVTLFDHSPDETIIKAFLKLFRKILILLGVGLAITSLPLPPTLEIFVHNTIFVVIAFFVLVGLFDLSNIAGMFVKNRAHEFEVLVNRVLKIISATIVLMVTMRHFNYDIWHIMTALGVGTLAVGLAAQPTLTNMIAGFTILIDRPFRRGDRISLSGGESGDVVNIGMRSTHILTTDGNMLIVSNSELVNSRLINFSFPNSGMGHKVKFYVDHSAGLPRIKIILRSLAENIPGVAKGSVNVLLTGVNDWGTEITVFFNVEHFSQTVKMADALIDATITEFQKQNIRIATNPLPPQPKA